jgi:hypothetical protein
LSDERLSYLKLIVLKKGLEKIGLRKWCKGVLNE